MKHFKMWNNVWWVKWLKNRVGEDCVCHVIIPAHYTEKPSHFSRLEAKLWHIKTETKNIKVAKLQSWWNLSKLVTNITVVCSFNSSMTTPPPSPSFLLGENRSSEDAVCDEWVIFFCMGIIIKTWGRVLLGAWV